MKTSLSRLPAAMPAALRLSLVLGLAVLFAGSAGAQFLEPRNQNRLDPAAAALEAEAIGLAAFMERVGEPVVARIVEIEGQPPAFGNDFSKLGRREGVSDAVARYARKSFAQQDAVVAAAERDGISLLRRSRHAMQADGRIARIDYRFYYLLNGFVAYVAESDIDRLRALPGVASISEPMQPRLALDNSVNYVLGTDFDPANRRLGVYGAIEELIPLNINDPLPAGHPEDPDWANLDGFEGQGMYLAVVDSGLDYQNPMFGGHGSLTRVPQVGGAAAQPPSPDDNRKVVYFYNLAQAATLDDFGHGTHVAATAGGFLTDGSYVNQDLTSTMGAPPVPMHGVAPQVKMLGYAACNASSTCVGDIELGVEDAASPTSLTGTGDGGSVDTGVDKPVGDVVNLSLSGGSDPAGASSRVANNAVLSGMAVVAAASNDGPGPSTVGAPCVGTLTICVAAVEDPGSIAGTDVLAAGSVLGDTCAGIMDGSCAAAGPAPETGATSDANTTDGSIGLKLFFMAGGGAIPDGSVSAHYTFVDRDVVTVPASVGNRIAVLKGGTGTFFQIVNPVATNVPAPAAIMLSSTTQSATAVAVVQGVPVFTIAPGDAEALLDEMIDGDDDTVDPAHGAVSLRNLRVSQSVSLDAFTGAVAGFSSRGPNAHPNARFRTIKPDVGASGVGVFAGTTPTGNPDDGIGMANPSGYTAASGTSMSSPHVAGAAILVRQYLRTLGFDTTDLLDPLYREKRFEAAWLTRALLSNTATNLRTGRGVPDSDPAPDTINDVGAGLIDLAGALSADGAMTTDVTLQDATPNEYTPIGTVPAGSVDVRIPTHSFGEVGVAGLIGTLERQQEVFIRDISPAAAGAGLYDLSFQNNRNATVGDGVTIDFVDATSTPITQVNVPAGGEASFFVRIVVDGTLTTVDPTEIMWYVTAQNVATSKTLRMPFYYRAISPDTTALEAPVQSAITEVDDPAGVPCPIDNDGDVRVNWTFTGIPPATQFRVQCATTIADVFTDDASEPLAAGANSLWAGSEQWVSQANPDTGSLAYYIPDAAEQNESLAMIAGVAIPAGSGASLAFESWESIETDFDFGYIEVSSDGGPFSTVGAVTGIYAGPRSYDLTPFAGTTVRVRFRMESDLVVSDIGWYVDDIRIQVDDYTDVGFGGAADTSLLATGLPNGDYTCRVNGLFDDGLGNLIVGPGSNEQCVSVQGVPPLPSIGCTINSLLFADSFESGDTSAWTRTNNPTDDLAIVGGLDMDGNNLMEISIEQPPSQREHWVNTTHAGTADYCFGFIFDPNSIAMEDNKRMKIWGARGDDNIRLLDLLMRKHPSGEYRIVLGAYGEGFVGVPTLNTGFAGIPDAPVVIGGEWVANSAPGANDGVLRLFVNGVQVREVFGNTGVRNLTTPGMGFLGNLRGVASGSVRHDNFQGGSSVAIE